MTTISSIDARYAQDQIGIASQTLKASVSNLATGQRADANVADLSVGTVLAARVGTLRVTVGNAGQAKSLLETAKGALNTILSLLQKQKNLAVKAADDSLSNNERGFLNQEFQAIVSEIDRIASTANFNGKKLLDGSISGVAGTTTSTGIANEQYSLLNAKDTTATGTVSSGSLINTHATVGSNKLFFGAGGGSADTITFQIDSDASTGSTTVQQISYSLTATATAAEHAAAFIAAVNTAVSGSTASTYSNFAQFDYTDNGDGSVTVTAKEAGAHLNNYAFSADNNTNTATIRLGTDAVGGTIEAAGGADQALEKVFTVGTSAVTGANGIFKVVAANNIADQAINAVLTFGTPSTASGSANGVKQTSTLTSTGVAWTASGTYRTVQSNIDVAADANGATSNSITFAGQTITIGTAVDSTTHVNVVDFATKEAQGAAFAAKFQALSNAADPVASAIGRYNFSTDGNGAVVATAKYYGTVGNEVFTKTELTAGNSFDTTESTTAAGTASRDTYTFGGAAGTHTIVFTENDLYGQVTAAANTTYINVNDANYNTAAEQLSRMADALNNAGNGNIDEYTFSATSTVLTAQHTNFGATIAADDIFAETTDQGNRGTVGGYVAGVAGVAETSTFYLKDASGTTIGSGIDFTLAANTGATAYTAANVAAAFVAAYNADATSASRYFDITDNGDGTVDVVGKIAGTELNDYSIAVDRQFATQYTASLSGSTIADGTTGIKLNTMNVATLGTNKSIAPSDLTFNPDLIGSLTNLKGTFTLGTGNNGVTDLNNNTAQFTVDVNGKTYTSNIVQLTGSSAVSTISNTIAAGTKLTFQNASGPVDANGAYTDGGFQLTVETDINLATVTNSSTGQNSLNTAVENLQSQLDSISLAQDRSLGLDEISASSGDHRITSAIGTILDGIRGFDAVGTNRLSYNYGDIRLTSNEYGDTGDHGDITSFSVSRLTDTITTTINGEVFTAYLNSANAPTLGGVEAFGTNIDGTTNNGSYNSTTKVITLGSSDGSTAKLNFYSADTTDGRILTIDLGHVSDNVSQINISTSEGETALSDALNAVFNVSSNDSLSFQVGAAATDTIGVSIGSAKTESLYKDEDDISQTLSVDTSENAITASGILDSAINNAIRLISDVSAAITSFDSSIQNNQASIQNADAARSKLLDTDYTAESTRFAEARVRVDAATAVLAQVNTRIQNLLRLLQQ